MFGWVPQSSMGRWVSNSTSDDRVWNKGFLAIGEVTKVFPKRYTAEVRLVETGDVLGSSEMQEGRYAPRIGVSSAGFSEEFQVPYGEIMPIHVGDLVLVGCTRNNFNAPVILKVMHDLSEDVGSPNYRNILANFYNQNTSETDITDYVNISPIQDYRKIDKYGNFEISSHTKSFLIGQELNFDEETFDYEDLSVKYPTDKTVVNPFSRVGTSFDVDAPNSESDNTVTQATIHVSETNSKPKKYLAVFRDKFYDTLTNWLRIAIDAGKTSIKVLQSKRSNAASSAEDTDGTMTVAEIDKDGTFRIRRHLDTFKYKNVESKHFSDIQLRKDGSVIIEVANKIEGADEYPRTVMSIHGETGEVKMTTSSKLTIATQQGIDMKSQDNINMISEKQIKMMSKEGIILGSEDQISMVSNNPITMQSEKVIGIYGKSGTSITSDKVVQVSGSEEVAVTSMGNVGVQATQNISVAATQDIKMAAPKTDIKSPKMEITGKVNAQGSLDLKGACTVKGKMKFNGRGVVLKGDRDTKGRRNFAIFSDILVSIAVGIIAEQAASILMKKMPVVATLVSSVAKAFTFYQFDPTAIKSLSTTYNTDMFYDTQAFTSATMLIGHVISENSPFYDGLLHFIEQSNNEKAAEALAKQYQEGSGFGSLSTELSQSKLKTQSIISDTTNTGDINLDSLQDFVEVGTPLVGFIDNVIALFVEKDSPDSIVSQMKYLITPANKGGLGLDLTSIMNEYSDNASDFQKISCMVDCTSVIWNNFTQINDFDHIFNLICNVGHYYNGVNEFDYDAYVGTQYRKITVEYDEDADRNIVKMITKNRMLSSANATTEDPFVPYAGAYRLSDQEKAVIRDILKTVRVTVNKDALYARRPDTSTEYTNNTSYKFTDLDFNRIHSEGDYDHIIHETDGTNGTTIPVTTYIVKCIDHALDEVSDVVYTEHANEIPVDIINPINYKVISTTTIASAGYKAYAQELEQQIDAQLGTNSQKYAMQGYTLQPDGSISMYLPEYTSMQEGKSTLWKSYYTLRNIIYIPKYWDLSTWINTSDTSTVSAMTDEERRDRYIDRVVKRYLWENACQILEQLNYAWTVSNTQQDALNNATQATETLSGTRTFWRSLPESVQNQYGSELIQG